MVEEADLIRIEKLSNNISQLIFFVENQIANKRLLDRYVFRAKSPFYQLLINLEYEVNTLKSSTLIIPQQLIEIRKKVNALLRLVDETNSLVGFDNSSLDNLEENIKFNAV